MSLHIITGERETVLPDVTTLAAPRLFGDYSWTLRSYPKARFAEALTGLEPRRIQPMTVSRARRIVLG